MTSSHRSLLLQNSHAIPWSAPNTKPATVNSANPVRKARGLPEIGNGLAGASAASSPKGGNRTSKMAHKIYATLRVTVSESACTFQESAFGSAAVGVEDFASGAAFGAAATGVEGFAIGATGDGFGGAATVADGGALGAALSCCPSPARTIGAGMAAGAAFGAAGSGVEGGAIGAVLSCCPSPPGTAIGYGSMTSSHRSLLLQ